VGDARVDRRGFIAAGALAGLGVLTGCGSVGDAGGSGGSGEGALKVGLLVPQSGVYAPLGKDMEAGWGLYLSEHGGRLGGRRVTTVVADEGEGPDTGVPAAQRLIRQDRVDVLVGVVSSTVALGIRDLVEESGKLLLVANAGADAITGPGGSPLIWRTSFTNAQTDAPLGRMLASEPGIAERGGVYTIAADYAAGDEHIAGFRAGYEGGRIAGQAKTPFGTTQDFQPFLGRIRSSGAAACMCFYAGAEAVAFVKQYAEFGLAERVPLYGSGFLTEGGVLEAQGEAARGVRTSLHYAAGLDNPANARFARAYEAKAGLPPTVYAVQAWDAALVLDQALQGAESLEGRALADRLGTLGEIAESPRGAWSFDGQSPRQRIYLREVELSGGAAANAIVEDLGETPPTGV
jgi:branched-chain amino acid transport system substrate-binding protein